MYYKKNFDINQNEIFEIIIYSSSYILLIF